MEITHLILLLFRLLAVVVALRRTRRCMSRACVTSRSPIGVTRVKFNGETQE